MGVGYVGVVCVRCCVWGEGCEVCGRGGLSVCVVWMCRGMWGVCGVGCEVCGVVYVRVWGSVGCIGVVQGSSQELPAQPSSSFFLPFSLLL